MKTKLQVNPNSWERLPGFLKLVNGRNLNVKFFNGWLEVDESNLDEVVRLANINKIHLMI